MEALTALVDASNSFGVFRNSIPYGFVPLPKSTNFLCPPTDFRESKSLSPNDRGPDSNGPYTSCSPYGCSNAKIIKFRGHNVAAFDMDGKEMICLPQVYEIFLKHLVGGLHTVYTKLKRLDINPTVCNVDQVRALRSLGAIQPGVNRCKLLETRDFEKLYDDCANTSGEDDQRASDDGTPLNLSKSGTASENDAESVESMRKEDSSPNNSVSDRGGSNSNSMSVEGGSSSGKNDEGSLMNKVMSLIEIASQQFKHEREELWRERNEIQVLRESFHKIVQEERNLRKKLESETRKCSAYEKRYKFVNRQLLLVKAELRRCKERTGT